MDRRSFLAGRFHYREPGNTNKDSSALRPVAGLEPYVPSAEQPWDTIRIGHLLRRLHFMPRWSDITSLKNMSPSQAVHTLLNTPSTPNRPAVADSVTESLEGLDTTYQEIVRGQWGGDAGKLRTWYAGVMRDAELTFAEKMTGFWSNHFATEFQIDLDYVIAPLLYRQNEMFRTTGLGNFKDLMMGITLDAAMLVYLGGHLNVEGQPNENYAREMLELFTTGLGHYTEGDIQEAARILTGWKVAQFSDQQFPNGIFTPYFIPKDHDINAKQFLGVSFPARDVDSNTEFLVRRDEVRKVVDTIFQQRPDAVATFICRKLYTFFVYSNPTAVDETIIGQMAQIFKDNDFEIQPVLAALFNSAHFFDNLNIGAQIKTPAELMIGMARQLGADRDLADDMEHLEQTLFDPPNVSGWPGYRNWITTTTYPVRAQIAESVVSGMDESELLTFIKQFPNYTDGEELVKDVAALLLPRSISDGRRDSLLAKLINNSPYDWGKILNDSPSTAARNMREMLRTVTQLPDFQLC